MPSDASTRAHSIGTRLTLLYTLIALVAVALFASVIYWRLSTNFAAGHVRFLQAKAVELQRDLSDAGGDPRGLLAEIAKETAGTRLREYLARVISADGRVLGETPGMGGELQESWFPLATGTGPSSMLMQRRRAGNHDYELTTLSLSTTGTTQPLRVQVALDVTRDDALLSDFRRAMALAFLLLIPLLLVAGRWVAARGLAPLKRISSAARAVTPAHLSGRIPLTPPWPSELEDLVQVFNAMLNRIEEAFARLSRFSADLAHELRTPLSNLSGEFEVSLMNPRSPQDYRAAIESGLEEYRRLNVLIENLLFMARAEHAELALRRERFDAAQACAWVIAQHASAAAGRGIAIELEGAAGIDADPALFRQALANLLTNAIRHSSAGGLIRVGLRIQPDASTELRVRDEGEGIEARHLAHVFDRFYQVDAARHRDAGQGTGLGLSIVKTIVDLHHGSVRLESTPGAGTTVILRFPAR